MRQTHSIARSFSVTVVTIFVLTSSLGCDNDAREEPAGATSGDTPAGSAEPPPAEPAEAPRSPKRESVYQTNGVVMSVADDRSSVTIDHQDVPGYMPAMTMPFFSRQPSQLGGIETGQKVRFEFERDESGKHYLVSITKI